MTGNPVTLQVLICTIGRDGIRRVEKASHPEVQGVEYLVSWQQPDEDIPVPETLARRADFKVVTVKSRGLSRNRNHAVSVADALWCLIGDDDVDYSTAGLQSLLQAIASEPDMDLVTMRYTNGGRYVKRYPDCRCDLHRPVKGYYVTSFEIAFRRSSLKPGVGFNEKLGIGNPVLASGEEEVFVHDFMSGGGVGVFLPITIGAHNHQTTGERDMYTPGFIKTHGAVMSYLHPYTWFLRLLVHAFRSHKSGGTGVWYYMRNALSGICYARRQNVFRR